MTAKSPAGLGYRPELDGVRGIAVLLVVGSHAGVPLMAGAGAVGVTLFFVLSGYLITGLLMKERGRTGGVDLREFYVRRVRRLAPALIAVVAVTGVVMVALGRFAEYPGQAVAALLYSANLSLGSGSDLWLLSHTWSLSLEEQFYAFWPILIVAGVSRTSLARVAVGGAAVVVLLRLWLDPAYPVTGLPWFRGDAVLLGSALALWGRSLRVGSVAAIALAMAVPAVIPSGWVVAAIAAVAFVGSAASIRWLRHPILVRVGELSYGLYLWHLAPVVLAAPHGPLAVGAAIVLSFVLALASERWIEKPWRLRSGHLDVGGDEGTRPAGTSLHDGGVARVGLPALDGVGVAPR